MRSPLHLILLAMSTAAALEMKVDTNSIICEDDLVKMSLTSACGDTGECQLGVEQYVEGSFVYGGLQDKYADTISGDSTLVMDATLRLGVGHVTTVQYKLVDKVDVPVCSAFKASNYNKYGDCPADGRYTFDAPFNFPIPQSSFVDWAASGYEGQIDLKIYFGSDLVGQCVIQASTVRTKSSKMPSGKIGAVVVATFVGLLLTYITAVCLGGYCAKKRMEREARDAESEKPELLSEPMTRYNRFEAGGAIYEADYGGDFEPVEGPTRSFANGPVI